MLLPWQNLQFCSHNWSPLLPAPYPENTRSIATRWHRVCCCSEGSGAAVLAPGSQIQLQVHFLSADILPHLWALTQNMQGCWLRFLKIILPFKTTDSKNSFRYTFLSQKLCSKIITYIIKFPILANTNIPPQEYIFLLSSTKHFIFESKWRGEKKEKKSQKWLRAVKVIWNFRDGHAQEREI